MFPFFLSFLCFFFHLLFFHLYHHMLSWECWKYGSGCRFLAQLGRIFYFGFMQNWFYANNFFFLKLGMGNRLNFGFHDFPLLHDFWVRGRNFWKITSCFPYCKILDSIINAIKSGSNGISREYASENWFLLPKSISHHI